MSKRSKGKKEAPKSTPDLGALSEFTKKILKVPKSKLNKKLASEGQTQKRAG